VDCLRAQQCKYIVILRISWKLVAQDENFVLLNLSHLHNLLSENVSHYEMQWFLVLRVGEYCQHLLRWFLFLNNHHLHILLHIMIGVIEFFQEFWKCICWYIPNENDMLSLGAFIRDSVLWTKFHQFIQFWGLLRNQHNDQDYKDADHNSRKIWAWCNITISNSTHRYNHIIECTIKGQLFTGVEVHCEPKLKK